MQRVHENVQLLDPPLPPEEPTPGQRLFRPYLRGRRPEMEKEYEAMHQQGLFDSGAERQSQVDAQRRAGKLLGD